MKTTDQVLAQRGAVYCDFFEGISLESEILSAICGRYESQHGENLPMDFYLFFSKIAMKLSRLSVCPDHIDSWTDIAGYARLVEINLTKLQGEKDAQGQQESNATITEDAHNTKVRKKARTRRVRQSTREHRSETSSFTDDTGIQEDDFGLSNEHME